MCFTRGRLPALTLALVLLSFAARATPAAASGAVSSFSVTPASTTAGSSPNLGVDMKFAGGDTPKSLTIGLAPGLWASLKAAPAGTTVGSGTIAATALGVVPISAPATVKTNAVPSGAPSTALTGVQVTATAAGQTIVVEGYAAVSPANANLQLVIPSLPNSAAGLPLTISEISLTLDGTIGGAKFIRLPTSSGPASSTLSATTYSGASGTGSSSFTPTGSPSYTPRVASIAAKAVNSALNAQVTVDIQQPDGQAGTSAVALTLPTDVLAINPNAVQDLTPGGTQVGTAQLTTPLLSSPVSGSFSVSGTVTKPVATVKFPLFGISFSGPITNLLDNPTVSLSGVPDVPFTDLSLTLTAENGLFNLACNGASGSATSQFTSHWSGLGYTPPDTPVTISGCPNPADDTPTAATNPGSGTSKAGRPTVSGARLSGLAKGRPALSFTVAQGKGAAKLGSVALTLPSGLAFVRRGLPRGLSLAGAKLKREAVSAHRLTVWFRAGTPKVKVALSSRALAVSRTLRSAVARHRTRSLSAAVVVKAGGVATRLGLGFKKLS